MYCCGFVCTKKCLHVGVSALLILTSSNTPRGYTSAKPPWRSFRGRNCLRFFNTTTMSLSNLQRQCPHRCLHLLTASDVSMTILAHHVYLCLMLVYFQVSEGGLFSKSPQPCVLVWVWKTKIKSPQCEMYLHPWHLNMTWVFPKHRVARASEPYHWCQAWDFYSETTLQRQKASVGKKTIAINTTERLGSLTYIMNNGRKTANALLARGWK